MEMRLKLKLLRSPKKDILHRQSQHDKTEYTSIEDTYPARTAKVSMRNEPTEALNLA